MMSKSLKFLFLVCALISSLVFSPVTVAHAVSLPAQMNKQFSPIAIKVGGVSQLSVTIFNPNAFPLTGATWQDSLTSIQPGLVIATPANLSNNCGGAATGASGTTTLSLTGGSVPAQVGTTPGQCTVTVDVTSNTTGNLINTIPIGALSAQGSDNGTPVTISNTTPASATLNVGSVQPPTVSKSFTPNIVWVGQTSQLAISINNNDPSITLTQASITDSLPLGVVLANPVSPTLTNCGGSASLTAVAGGTSVTLNTATIAPATTCVIHVNVVSNAQAVYTNRIPANSLQTQQGATNATAASANLSVQAIGVSKAFLPASFSPGGTTTLTITLQNPTAAAYTGVAFTDTLPAGLTVASAPASPQCGGTITSTATSIHLGGGTIPAGNITTPGTCTISVQVTAPAGTPSGTFTNTIPARTLTTTQGVTNLRSASATVTVNGSDVRAIKSFSPTSIPGGGNSRLRLDFFAPGDTGLSNFSVTDNLPAGLTISNSTPATTSGCGSGSVLTAVTGTTLISLTNGTVAAGARCRINVYVTGNTAGTYTNTIPPTNITDTEGRRPAGDTTAVLTVANQANLSIDVVKGFNPLTVFGGSASTMSVQLINPNTSALSGIAFTDNMPAGMIIANPPNLTVGTCGGTLSGAPGAGTFSFSGGSLPASGTCTLTLSVTMTVNGNLTNTIGAGAVTTVQGASNPQAAAASLTNLPGASVSKVFSPNPIAAGLGNFSLLTITIQNTSNIPLDGMGLDDNLPAGLQIAASPAPAPVNNCGGSLTAVTGTQFIQLTGGSLAASASCTIVVAVTSATPGSYQNSIPIGALSSNQGASNTEPATDTLVVTAAANAAIGDFVWNDVNANGIQDAGEAGIPNVTVHLLDSGGAVIGTTTTDANGLYHFTNLVPGTYSVEFVPPAGYTVSPANQGANDAVDSDADTVTGRTGNYTLVSGQTNNTVDAGLHLPVNQNGMTKIITATNQASTGGTQVTIGEIVTYQTGVTIPPGTYTNAQLVDTLQQGLAFVDCVSITGPGLTTTAAGGFAGACNNPTVGPFPTTSSAPADVGRLATFGFGTLANGGASDATLTVTYRAVVIDSAGNVNGASLNNSAAFASDQLSLGPASATVQIVEPKLEILKTSNNPFVAVGSDLAFTLTLQHTAASKTDAFDVTVTDALPIYLDFVPGSLDCTTGAQDPTPCTYDTGTRTITATWSTFALAGGNGVIQFHVVPNSLPGGNGAIKNVGNTAWSSLPGDVSTPQSSNTLSTERFYDPTSSINVYGASATLTLTPLGSGGGGNGNRAVRGSEAAAYRGAVLIPITGFAPGKVTDLSGMPKTTYDASADLTLDIPKLNLKMPIVGVALSHGTWDVNWLLDRAGWLEQTAFPTFTGNSVVTGHVTLSNGDPGPFARLSTLAPGDLVFVHAFGQLYIYQVRSTKSVKPDDISIFRHEDKAWLSLVTCGNYDAALGTYLNRTVVRAELIQTEPDPYSGR
jgi:LPXTG-site transpeptidase (sortase) family protein